MPLLNNMKKQSEELEHNRKKRDSHRSSETCGARGVEAAAFKSKQAAVHVGRLDQKGTG